MLFSLNQALEAIKVASEVGSKQNFVLVSGPGTGKSQGIKGLASEMGYGLIYFAVNTANEGDLKYSLPVQGSESYTVEYRLPSGETLDPVTLTGKSTTVQDIVSNNIMDMINLINFREENINSEDPAKKAQAEQIPAKWFFFIDEINRGATAHIINEFMTLITERQIGDVHLPDCVQFIGAMNPDSSMEDLYGHEIPDMGVRDLDAAVRDRFTILYVQASLDDFLDWGLSQRPDADNFSDPDLQTNILPDVALFFKEHEDLYNVPSDVDNKRASSRSITMLSDTIRGWIIKHGDQPIPKNILLAWAYQLGHEVANGFFNYWFSDHKPLPAVNEFYKDGATEIDQDFIDEADLKTGTAARRTILTKQLISYTSKNMTAILKKKNAGKLFGLYLMALPEDYRTSALIDISKQKNYTQILSFLLQSGYPELIQNISKISDDMAKFKHQK